MTNKKPTLASLQADLAAAQAKVARALADYTNLEKRFERDSASIVKFANATLLEKLLEIRDHLGMAALAPNADPSLPMILASFDRILAEEGVTDVPTTGSFDPASMECQETEPGEKDQIVRVIRRGYRLHDRVLRPARVVVGDGTSGSDLKRSAQPEPNTTVREGQTLQD
jgi:molecular chaperone GrpE